MNLAHDSSLSERVIKMAIDVHRELGPGLLESAYEDCLCYEQKQSGMDFARQVPLPVIYKSVRLDCGYRMDVVVEQKLVLKIKSIERIMPIHEAQMLTYLRLSGRKIGLLMNFNNTLRRSSYDRLLRVLRVSVVKLSRVAERLIFPLCLRALVV